VFKFAIILFSVLISAGFIIAFLDAGKDFEESDFR